MVALLRSVSVNVAELSPSPRLRKTRRRVLAWSSGAPGGGVATVRADDEAGLSLRKVGATGLNGGAFVAKEEGACLGGEAVGSGIGVPIFGINPSRGDKVVPAPINITFRSHARVAASGGAKLRLINSTEKFGHFTLFLVHFVIDGLLLGLLGIKPALFRPMFLGHSFRVRGELFPFEIAAVVRLLNGFHFEGAAGLGNGVGVSGLGRFVVVAIEGRFFLIGGGAVGGDAVG